MTTSPNEMSDEELRKQLVKSLSTAQVESVDDSGEAVIEHEADRLLQLITADRKRVELEARIAENESWYALGRMIDPREFVAEIGGLELKKQELVAELKAQQEEI